MTSFVPIRRRAAVRSAKRSLAAWFVAVLAGGAPGVAEAAPGNSTTSTGTATATAIDPGRMVAREFLRFGMIAKPTTAGTLTVSHSGTVTATGSMVTGSAIPQAPGGRGPAEFDIYATGYRAFVTIVGNSVTISNGTSTMLVNNITGNFGQPRTVLDPTGYFRLKIGGRLNVGANQPAGDYVGTFTVSVIYQ